MLVGMNAITALMPIEDGGALVLPLEEAYLSTVAATTIARDDKPSGRLF